jgi:hypothetical protein
MDMFCPAMAAEQNMNKTIKKNMMDEGSRMRSSLLIIAYF